MKDSWVILFIVAVAVVLVGIFLRTVSITGQFISSNTSADLVTVVFSMGLIGIIFAFLWNKKNSF